MITSDIKIPKQNVIPLGDRVILQRLEQEEKLKGGLVLPDSAKKKQERARIIAVGQCKTTPSPIKVGDVVLIEKYSGQELRINDEDFVIAKADDLIAIILN